MELPKQTFFTRLLISFILFFGIVFGVQAINITVPSAPSSGYWLTSTTTGAYIATTTNPMTIGSILTASTTATSTFLHNISLKNNEFIDNGTDGTVKICGNGSTYNQCLNIGLNNQYFTQLSQSTINGSASGVQFAGTLNIADNTGFIFGSQSPARFIYRTGGNRSLNLETYVNGGQSTSGYIVVAESVDGRVPANNVLDPTLRIYSSDSTQARDFVEFYHNQTDGVIGWGNGNLSLGNGTATTTINNAGYLGLATSTPNSTLSVAGSVSYKVASTSVSTTLTASDYQYVTHVSGITFTLPTAVGIIGREYSIKNMSTSTVDIATTGGQTIDANASPATLLSGNNAVLFSDGTNWLLK